MKKNYGAISKSVEKILHGADYNPDQWLHLEGILGEDVRLMKLANSNVMSVNIFGWAACEPAEGVFEFGWLDTVLDTLHENGVNVFLATPSGSRPNWMAQKYPEVLRVNKKGQKLLYGKRHNHCYTSKIYREKVGIINTKLAERYGNHPGVIMWHVSNEYGGECYCELCQQAFREFLQDKYGSLDELNQAWWNSFWSHTYTEWAQINPPSNLGEPLVHALNLDWARFRTHQTVDFYKNEIEPLRRITPHIPVTTNFDQFINIKTGPDYWKFAPYVDVVSWDNYPLWHGEREDYLEAGRRAFIHDINRSLKQGRPFILMESSPSATNWQPVAKLRRPGMQALASMQAVAHGADTVQYFQWRKCLGGFEKFHGAVVDHFATENTRVFEEVKQLGSDLAKLNKVVGMSVQPEVAIIYDWENFWAITDSSGPHKDRKEYFETVQSHYQAFWNMGIPCDVINEDCDISSYRLVIAPMMYMVRKGVGEKIESFVKNGGQFVATYWSGIVNETDLCFRTGRPGPLRRVLGIWSEEIDALYDGDTNTVTMEQTKDSTQKTYTAEVFCDLIHAENAEVLATYKQDFYQGRPALTKNTMGKGTAYYIAFRSYDDFLNDFYAGVALDLNLAHAIDAKLPKGVTAQTRYDEDNQFVFLQNYTNQKQTVFCEGTKYVNTLTGAKVDAEIELAPYQYLVIEPAREG